MTAPRVGVAGGHPRHEELVAARKSGKLVLRQAAALEDRRCARGNRHPRQTSTTSLLVWSRSRHAA